MKVNYSVTKDEKKRLVKAIAGITGQEIEYLGVPSFAYIIGGKLEVSREGILTIPDGEDSDELLRQLSEQGFEGEQMEEVEEEPTEENEEGAELLTEGDKLTIEVPRDSLTEEAISNLNKIIESKGEIMKHAFGADELPIEVTDEKVSFPWFKVGDADTTSAYTKFISNLCSMAMTQKRISAKAKEAESEKFAFRCFLLRLGFIGNEYKEERRILLQNLTGSAAFPTQKAADEFAAKQKAKREADRVSEEEVAE
ncbi:virulence protein [Butyrivibrio sp. CB08]|uniref:virulence protein n=1 Tax=Butyrivibrio sp. CB08 TaxID=2364879 RepID=UPI0018F64405|nr:virulence protein [Butyrivibrio sp. CB08]